MQRYEINAKADGGYLREDDNGSLVMYEDAISLEKQYAESLGRMAQLCDIVLPWLGKATKDDEVWPQEVREAYDEIMDYVDAVRP